MAQSHEDEIVEVVDEFADELNPGRVQHEAEQLGLTVDALLDRIVTEVKARLS